MKDDHPLRTAPARRLTLAAALLLPLTACYRYTPASLAELRPGEHVRAHFTAVEADRLSPVLGGEFVRRVDGVLVDADSAGVLLEVPSGQRAPTYPGAPRLNQQIRVGRDGVAHIELKQLDRMRTGAVLALGATAVGVVIGVWVAGPRGDRGPGEFEIPDMRSRFTLVSIPW